jgi:hypothetical protein
MAPKRTGLKAASKKQSPAQPEKRVYFKQSDFPLVNLQQAQKIASALVDNFGGGSASPPDVALALGISPTSSAWQYLTGAAVAYGLTDGGYNAEVIKLLPLGRRLVAPEEEGEDLAARREAILRPRILRGFFEKYRRAKFPSDVIAVNVLKGFSIPADRAEAALKIVKENGRYASIIRIPRQDRLSVSMRQACQRPQQRPPMSARTNGQNRLDPLISSRPVPRFRHRRCHLLIPRIQHCRDMMPQKRTASSFLMASREK